MTSSLFLLGIVAVVIFGSVFVNTAKVKTFVSNKTHTRYIPKAISMLLLTAQISELVRVVEHVNIVNLSAALLLLVIVVATKSGIEGETP